MVQVERMLEGLRVAMYLTGCSAVNELSDRPLLLGGPLVEALRSLDMDYRKVAG